MPRADAPHIAELKSAGAIPIARTNMPDFGLRWHTDNALRGPTLNPWDAGRTPGGSSGGDASALAAGMTPLGMGNDLAGSLRWPSQCCGTVALKPGLGRVAMARMRDGVAPAIGSQLLAVHGPMARSIPDLRLAFGSMCGRSPSDPWHVPLPLDGPPVERPIRVSVVADPSGLGVDPDIANAVARAADALADAGYAVEAGEPPSLQRAAEVYFQILAIPRNEGAANPMEDLASKDFTQYMGAMSGALEAAGGEPVPDTFGERHALARAWGEFQEQRPLILAPVATVPACPLGFDLREGDDAVAWIRALRMIVVVNLLGLPSVALPTGEANGLPHGVQIIGPRYREDLCLDAAEAVEERLGAITPIDPR
jgi:amidase